MPHPLNTYGDSMVLLSKGFGVDVASQRADDLDNLATDFIKSRTSCDIPTLAMDICCGAGGQSIRMAQEGAKVLAIDVISGLSLFEKSESLGLGERIEFHQADARALDAFMHKKSDVIVCQRAIHHFKYSEALAIVSKMRSLLSPGGRVYISASGLFSEFGQGYAGSYLPLQDRYSTLSPEMQNKHGILGSVCLYSKTDMASLLREAGLTYLEMFTSAFGNIKAVAVHE